MSLKSLDTGQKGSPAVAGLPDRDPRGEGCSRETDIAYQVTRGPTNHWVSPSTNFTSPARPQFGLNFTCAPSLP